MNRIDREKRGIRVSNTLCLLACIVLTFVTLLTGADRTSGHFANLMLAVSTAIYLTGFVINLVQKSPPRFVGIYIVMSLIYCGSMASYYARSTMIFAIMAMFSAGVAYFNKDRVTQIIHAIVTSTLLIVFSLEIKTGTGADLFFTDVRRFEPIEVVAAIIGIVVTDGFFMLMNTGRIKAKESIEEQERSTDELMKIIEAKADEARKATKSKSDFLASMSHEIRTPINSVLGMNEMILRETKEPDTK